MGETGLRRHLTVPAGTALAVGAVLGPSVLVLPALTARTAGPAALVAWGAMSLFGLVLAVALGRAGARIPDAGGIIAYVSHAFGPRCARVCGWWFLASVPLSVPVIALVGAHYVTSYFGLPDAAASVLALVLLFVSLWLNSRGLKASAAVQTGAVAAVGAVIAAISVAGLPDVRSGFLTPFVPNGWVTVGAAALLIFWSYIGFEMVVHLAEDFRRPGRDLPLSMGIASIVLSVLYCAAAFVTIGTGAYLQGNGLAPMSVVAASAFGRAAGVATAVFALACAFVAVHTNIAGLSRLLYAQARVGELPKALARLHSRHRTPWVALACLGVFFAVVLLADALLRPDLGELLGWPSATFLVLYLAGTAAAVKVLPPDDIGRVCAVVTFLGCLLVLPFGGWALLYPLAVLLLATTLRRGIS
ncbi:amino acid permease [Lentzea sp. NPDC042327]|uniref:APC family permease n=1 Tax=Lentzea sp. NPDC042327 TaxID=3154801 RepID=UPI0033FFE038